MGHNASGQIKGIGFLSGLRLEAICRSTPRARFIRQLFCPHIINGLFSAYLLRQLTMGINCYTCSSMLPTLTMLYSPSVFIQATCGTVSNHGSEDRHQRYIAIVPYFESSDPRMTPSCSLRNDSSIGTYIRAHRSFVGTNSSRAARSENNWQPTCIPIQLQ